MVNHGVYFLDITAGIAANDEGCNKEADCTPDGCPFSEFLHIFFYWLLEFFFSWAFLPL